jgi:hypothetical protein
MDHYQQASRVLKDVLAKKGSIKTLALADGIRNKVRACNSTAQPPPRKNGYQETNKTLSHPF